MSIKREIILNTFQELIFDTFGSSIESIQNLKADASERKLYRLNVNGNSCIGVYNENQKENLAFIYFTNIFSELGFNVPKILKVSADELFYIEEDLGDTTLFSLISNSNNGNYLNYYKQVMSDLIRFQTIPKDKIDFEYCYQTKEFNMEMVESDLKKFNEYFSRIKHREFENEINEVIMKNAAEVMMNVEKDFFLYRDFQPRNIMLKDNSLYYIDYQSGRKGPLQYDVASFLYSGSIYLSDDERNILLNFYLDELGKHIEINKEEFIKHFHFFVLLRLIQMLGSYAYQHFKKNDVEILKKVPKALANLKSISEKIDNEDLRKIILTLTKN